MGDLIVFPGSPWPDGHAVAALEWSARLDPETGLWFDLHLTSDFYPDVEDDAEDDEDGDDAWKQPTVWANYHRCTLSSTYWGNRGFLAAGLDSPLSLAEPVEFVVNDFAGPEDEPDEHDDFAFGIYLLGHDSAAHHRIRLTPVAPGVMSLDWRGRIALRYMDSTAPFRHEFHATAARVELSGIAYPKELSVSEAEVLLARTIGNAGDQVALLTPVA